MKTVTLLKACGSTLVAATIVTATAFGPAWAGEFKVACPDRNISSLSAEDIKASFRDEDDANPLILMLQPAAEKYLSPPRAGVLQVNQKVAQLLQEGNIDNPLLRKFDQ